MYICCYYALFIYILHYYICNEYVLYILKLNSILYVYMENIVFISHRNFFVQTKQNKNRENYNTYRKKIIKTYIPIIITLKSSCFSLFTSHIICIYCI